MKQKELLLGRFIKIMREELKIKLQSQFSFMQRDMSKDRTETHNTYQSYGCECGDGWFELLFELCQRIMNIYKAEGIDFIDIEILQIKEKFGTLRFYYRHTGDSNTIQAIDFLGVGTIRTAPSSDEECNYKQQISDIVLSYEKRSSQICEKCGNRGELRKDLNWKKTLCDECYREKLKSIEIANEKRKNANITDYYD